VFYLTPLAVAKLVADRYTEHEIVLTGEEALYSEGNFS
jgi:hypothetical protein